MEIGNKELRVKGGVLEERYRNIKIGGEKRNKNEKTKYSSNTNCGISSSSCV